MTKKNGRLQWILSNYLHLKRLGLHRGNDLAIYLAAVKLYDKHHSNTYNLIEHNKFKINELK